MPEYEAFKDHTCQDCANFWQHYIWDGREYAPTRWGHCKYASHNIRIGRRACTSWRRKITPPETEG